MSKGTSRISINEARTKLRELDGLTGQSSRRFDEILGRFELFARNGFGIEFLSDITATQVEQVCKGEGLHGHSECGNHAHAAHVVAIAVSSCSYGVWV